jgi:Cys-rich repeat protein
MRGRPLALGVTVVLLGAWACGGATTSPADAGADGASSSSSGGSSSGGSSSGGTRVPLNHRPNDAQCMMPAPPGDCTFNNPGAPCHNDADCADAGPNGRCVTPNGPPTCMCTWDACAGDAECQSGMTCGCHGSPYQSDGNACVPGNCRVDSDCGAGEYCSPSAGANTCGVLSGYYCHTSKDKCVDDADCKSSMPGTLCIFTATDGFWSCQQSLACGG